MKVLMLGWELPPHNSGGLGVACFHIAKSLSKDGVDVKFVVPYSEKHPEIDFMEVVNATNYSSLQKFGCGAYDSQNYFSLTTHNAKEFLVDIKSIQKEYEEFIKKYLKDEKNWPDVIHAHDWLTMKAGILAKKITGAPLITHIHATEFDRAGGQSGNPEVHQIEYDGINESDKVFAVSKNTRQVILDKYQIQPEKVEVVYNAIEPNSLAPAEDYDAETYRYLEFLKSQGYTIVMTLTRFTIQKGLTFLMQSAAKAIKENPKIAFLLVGDGEQRDELISMAAEYGISKKVFFTGFLRGKKWQDAYGVADVFVMSSVNEPFGLTALEAAHFNNALIISNQSGVGEVLQHVLRYDFWDVNKLAKQIIAVSTSRTLLNDLKNGAKNEYANISWQDIAKQIMDEFIAVTGAKNG